MSIPQEAPPPREFDPEHDQFAAVATQLLGVTQRHPEYYKEQATEILDKLNRAKGDFERGEVPIPQGLRINLFGGLQTRDESKPHEREANRIVEDLYISLNKLAGYQPTNYDDIEKDSLDLFDMLQGSGVKWAMSEFDNPFILEQAEQRGLKVNYIAERQNLKNRRNEILITNYIIPQITLW